ncbi:MAG: hypothetical protein KDD50_00445 [Bdellovibrionales bacterium]|nr:hypothetical protein [Bdellovibrionales bacterium]
MSKTKRAWLLSLLLFVSSAYSKEEGFQLEYWIGQKMYSLTSDSSKYEFKGPEVKISIPRFGCQEKYFRHKVAQIQVLRESQPKIMLIHSNKKGKDGLKYRWNGQWYFSSDRSIFSLELKSLPLAMASYLETSERNCKQ